MPMVAYEGVSASTMMADPIMAKLRIIAGRRPARSE